MKNSLNAFLIALAIVIAVAIATSAYKTRFYSVQNIVVTGLSEKNFQSDEIVWNGNFSRNGMQLNEVYAQLKRDETAIRNYLKQQGVTDSEMVFSAVDIQKNYQNKYTEEGRITGSFFSGYTLRQYITVDSKQIEKVEKLSREITGLIEQGIELNSQPPSYYYTKLNELKIALLAGAAQDARLRAETIAKNSKISLGSLKKANMGVFQITGKNTNEEYSYGGTFNTTSKEKTASITLRVEYGIK
jgi:hypothetical protein